MDIIETLKEQSAHIDKGIEKISAGLNSVHEIIKISKPDHIKVFEEEMNVLNESLNDIIKILSRSTEEQEQLLLECVNLLKETSDITSHYIESNITSDTDISNEVGKDSNSSLNKTRSDPEYDIEDNSECDSPDAISTNELSIAYDLLNKPIPKLL
ncbi:hypothetical protein RN001_009399 [Aquatica leii]|uniref:Uncharacterized protein n=1 Tax=Aquatica leii TaxID=1421715 RepID=A0AAN7P6L7_9COLE|nr:hypothetical protein RN001_009399 [Aquatica leii]